MTCVKVSERIFLEEVERVVGQVMDVLLLAKALLVKGAIFTFCTSRDSTIGLKVIRSCDHSTVGIVSSSNATCAFICSGEPRSSLNF